MGDYLQELGVISSGLVLAGSIIAFMYKADDLFSAEFKNDLAKAIKNFDPKIELSKSIFFFENLFDSIFGKKHFSLRRILASSVASLLTLSLVTVLFFSITSPEKLEIEMDVGPDDYQSFFISICFIAIFSNLIPDFFSLIETRLMLNLLRKFQFSIVLILLLLLADALFTFLIFHIACGTIIFIIQFFLVFAFLSIFSTFSNKEEPIMDQLLVEAYDRIQPWLFSTEMYFEIPIVYIFLVTSFFTSIWLWLYLTSVFFIQLCNTFNNTFNFFIYALPVSEKPFRSIGIISGMFACLFYWAIAGWIMILN